MTKTTIQMFGFMYMAKDYNHNITIVFTIAMGILHKKWVRRTKRMQIQHVKI